MEIDRYVYLNRLIVRKKSFESTMDSFKKIIIVEKMKASYDENGYLMMGIKEILLGANSLLIWLYTLV